VNPEPRNLYIRRTIWQKKRLEIKRCINPSLK
jgi:hypothetical protein